MTTRSGTIPSLHALRALSILLVLLSHCFLHARPSGRTTAILLSMAANGTVGVSIFFVISGFLITTLLLEEQQRFGKIDLRDFYLRRVFRILPAFFTYLLTIALLAALGVLVVSGEQLWRALTFTMDYLPRKNWCVGHTWSLSVEEIVSVKLPVDA